MSKAENRVHTDLRTAICTKYLTQSEQTQTPGAPDDADGGEQKRCLSLGNSAQFGAKWNEHRRRCVTCMFSLDFHSAEKKSVAKATISQDKETGLLLLAWKQNCPTCKYEEPAEEHEDEWRLGAQC